jgi:hypothetical protein
MAENDLHDLLEKLHSQIEHTQTLGPEDLRKLRDLEADIRALLERAQNQKLEPQPPLLEQLEAGVSTFEVTHPTLAAALSEMMAILSNAGI